MIERPCFRNVGRGFPIPFPEIYRAFCAQTFAVEFRIREPRDLIGRWGERILKGNYDLDCGVCNAVKK
jgi:hypothetical protein